MLTTHKPLRILIATPLGFRGHGGIDRLNDMIIDEVTKLPASNIKLDRLVTRGNGSLLWSPFIFLLSLVNLWIAARWHEVDLLHIAVAVKGSLYRKLILSRWARYCGVPYLLHTHGAGFEESWPKLPHFLRTATDRMFNESIAIVVLTSTWSQFISDRLPLSAKKVTLIPNGTPAVSMPPRTSDNDDVLITFLGELGPRKGTPQLVEALGILAPRKDWLATIAGNHDIKGTKKRIQELGIADRVTVPGWLDPVQTADLLRRTDIFVLPTFQEVLPMSILESMSYGVAIITTPVGAIPDAIVHERTGLIVPAGDVQALTAAIARLINDKELRRRLGTAARLKHATRFEISGCVARLIDLWRRLRLESKI
jgi:glycosyltransferase involved in cell wall biosynthesis